MLCERCQERQATVHVTRIINGEKTELNLCQECAREIQPQLKFSIPQFLAGLLDYDPDLEVQAPPAVEHCRECGLTYEQFHQTGRLGCPDCYHYLAPRLDPLIRRIQGSSQHRGKVPRRAGGNLRVRREMEKLKAQLQQLVQQEEFEKAARVRDQIRDLEARLDKEADGR
ncbi:UvrB/UvrC motif-containing protein [Moorella naiadis]|uniref:UvrB/UvrC motif-containing protein n=1 Tax=Moorella naiadis (nom. illeg.) TaxID=3093670 RepID=UPI003D9C9396